MRLVIDTNVLISALLAPGSLPAHLIALWRGGRFDLVTAPDQLDELRRVTRYPKIRERLAPVLAGRLMNDLRDLATVLPAPPALEACRDPDDDYLLGLAVAADAAFILTGDRRDLLVMGVFRGVRIVSVRSFLTLTRQLP